MPSSNETEFFCGWLLQWFHPMLTNYSRSTFKDIYLSSIFSQDSKDDILLFNRAKVYADTFRTRWNTFFESLWNHHLIQNLFNNECPQATLVNGARCGFNYIIETIAEAVFDKVFLGIYLIPTIYFKAFDGSSEPHYNIELLDKKGFNNY